MAIANLSPSVRLHSYLEDPFFEEQRQRFGAYHVDLRSHRRSSPIVFAYFHPLSRPHIEPLRADITRERSITVSGESILRFGFLEGDAIVQAQRAVFDPQTWQAPHGFRENGSKAEELAIVLNELELRAMGKNDDLYLASRFLMDREEATLIVAKGGVRGATVFERAGQVHHVPAYRSSRVFKIGSGDVFSGVFAHLWAERKLPAIQAADLASRAVSTYCSSGQLPLEVRDQTVSLNAIPTDVSGPIQVEGSARTLGQRFTLEEAQFLLRELGLNIIDASESDDSLRKPAALLLLADGLTDDECGTIIRTKGAEFPIVVLRETGPLIGVSFRTGGAIRVTDDFTTAIYFAAWAAMK
jgi:hypothetical protein